MIYLKRFCFAIIAFLCIFIGVVGTLIELFLGPILSLIYYVITGYNYFELSFSWKYTMKFLNWYHNKFGPNS